MNEKFNQNQTQFVIDEPLMAKPVVPESVVKPKKPPLPKWIWWLVSVLLVLITMALFWAWRNSRPLAPSEEKTSVSTMQQTLSPLEERLETARQLLKGANPTTQELPFPPLDMNLRIDPVKR
jgi:hypothetical protein